MGCPARAGPLGAYPGRGAVRRPGRREGRARPARRPAHRRRRHAHRPARGQRRRPVAAHRDPPAAQAARGHTRPPSGPRRAGVPAGGRSQGGRRRVARRRGAARHRVRRCGRRVPAGGPRGPAPPARRTGRPARRHRPAGRPAGRPGTLHSGRTAVSGGRGRVAAPGVQRRAYHRVRPARCVARGGPDPLDPPAWCRARHAGPPPGRPRRGGAGRRGGTGPDRGRPASRAEPVSAGGGRRGDRAPAHRPGHPGMAGRVLPAAAAAVAGSGALGAAHPTRRRARVGAHLGGVRPVRAGRRLAAGAGPGAQPAPAQSGPSLHIGPTPGADGRGGQRVHPRGGPARSAAARRVPARPGQGPAGRPQPGRRADRGRCGGPDRVRAGRGGGGGEAGPAAPVAARGGHPAGSGRPGHHPHGVRRGGGCRHARPALRAGSRRRRGHRPGRLVALEGPAGGGPGAPGTGGPAGRTAAAATGS